MTVIARTFATIPARSATDTWEAIVAMIAPDCDSVARQELAAVTGVACSLITDEALASDPLVVFGAGPRLRVYCVYGDAAIAGDEVNESALSFVPTAAGWRMSLPCPEEDLEWVERSLARVSQHVRARALGTDAPEGDKNGRDDRSEGQTATPGSAVVNLDAFLRR
jgi:hypothetical protein